MVVDSFEDQKSLILLTQFYPCTMRKSQIFVITEKYVDGEL